MMWYQQLLVEHLIFWSGNDIFVNAVFAARALWPSGLGSVARQKSAAWLRRCCTSRSHSSSTMPPSSRPRAGASPANHWGLEVAVDFQKTTKIVLYKTAKTPEIFVQNRQSITFLICRCPGGSSPQNGSADTWPSGRRRSPKILD